MDIFEEMQNQRNEQEAPAEKPAEKPADTTSEDTNNKEAAENNSGAAEQESAGEDNKESGSDKNKENLTAEEKSSENSNHQNESKDSGSEFANAELAEANAFLKKNPEKTYDDYKALKVPTSELNADDLIKQYLSEKEGKSPTQVALEMKKMELADDSDPDFEDYVDVTSMEYLEAKALKESLLQSASEWREDNVNEQLTGSKDKPESESIESPENFAKKQIEQVKKSREDYLTSTYNALNDIKEIPIDINGSTVSFVPSEDFRNEMKKTAEDVSYVTQKFFNEDGSIKNAKGFITEVAVWANEKTREEIIAFRVDQAIKQHDANNGKIRRNVNLGNKGNATETVNTGVPEGVTDYLDSGYDPNYN